METAVAKTVQGLEAFPIVARDKTTSSNQRWGMPGGPKVFKWS